MAQTIPQNGRRSWPRPRPSETRRTCSSPARPTWTCRRPPPFQGRGGAVTERGCKAFPVEPSHLQVELLLIVCQPHDAATRAVTAATKEGGQFIQLQAGTVRRGGHTGSILVKGWTKNKQGGRQRHKLHVSHLANGHKEMSPVKERPGQTFSFSMLPLDIIPRAMRKKACPLSQCTLLGTR